MSGYGEGNKAVPGLGGGFEYYAIGEALFLEDGNLNEAVGVAAIRDYVAYTESIPSDQRAALENPLSPYFLGSTRDADYYFYYESNTATTLNLDFLATLPRKPETTVIYADTCTLSADFMRTHNLIFKKIPRDITRF